MFTVKVTPGHEQHKEWRQYHINDLNFLLKNTDLDLIWHRAKHVHDLTMFMSKCPYFF